VADLGRHVFCQEASPLVDSAVYVAYAKIPQTDSGQDGCHCSQQYGLLRNGKGCHACPRYLQHNLQPTTPFRHRA